MRTLISGCVVFLAACGSPISNASDAGPDASGTSSLPTPCNDASNASKPQCSRDDPAAGTLGAGPSFAEGQVTFAGGYIAGSTLVVTGGDGTTGFLMAIDLPTGDRTLLSGHLDDPKQGNLDVGAGPAFAFPSTVAADGAGNVVVNDGLYRVDDQGARTLVSDFSTLVCTVSGATRVSPDTLSPTAGVGVAADGSFYMPAGDASSNGAVVKISASGSSCTVVSYSGNGSGVAAIGKGPTFDSLFSSVMVGGVLYGGDFARSTVFGIDAATGARSTVSGWAASSVGTGDNGGAFSIAAGSDNSLWTWGKAPTFTDTVVKIDLATGNRTGLLATSGPLSATNLTGVEVYGEWNGNVVLGMLQSVYLLDPKSLDTCRISH